MKLQKRHKPNVWTAILFAGIVTLLVCTLCSCQSLPRSGFDPYGERLFENCPLQSLSPSNCNLFGQRNRNQDGQSTFTATPIPPSATPVPGTPMDSGATIYSGPQPIASSTTLPGGFGSAQPVAAMPSPYGSTATAMGSNVQGINSALIVAPDAGSDTGPRPVFEDTGGYALPTAPIEGPALVMTPREQIAPVGSEVVLISSYLGNKDRLVTNEKVEWSLEGVGGIQKIDPGSKCDPLYFDYTKAHKITDRYVVTKTSQVFRHLDRGTPETSDDIHILRGQSWISVNSMREGTTHVTAFAPSLKDWSKRSDVGIIHWVDAQWVLPRLPIAPVGDTRLLTTTVLRKTNGQPRRGWIVRYEILNGPPSGFGHSNAQIEEVETDIHGQAHVQLSQREMRTGTNTIGIRIIRPAGVDGSDRRVTVGSETIHQTWSGNAGVRLQIRGPENAALGQDLPYQVVVTNTTPTLTQGTLVLTIPPNAVFVSSTPQGMLQGQSFHWNVAVPPNGTETVQAVLRAVGPGTMRPHAQYFPQGALTSPSTISPPIPGTSVPLPSNSIGSAPPSGGSIGFGDPAGQVPTLPSTPPPRSSSTSTGPSIPPGGTSEAATVFPGSSSSGGATPYTPRTGTGGTGATRFPSLKLEIVMNPNKKIEAGKPVEVFLVAQNGGSTEIRDITLVLSIPEELRQRINEIKGMDASVDRNFNILRTIPVIPSGGNGILQVEFPSISYQGYNLVGRAIVDKTEVRQTQKQISP